MRTVSLDEFAADKDTLRRLRTARRVVCVIGAGISTTSGIPDFRSAGGLYEHVKKKFNLRNGADLFDANLFRRADSTAMFHEFTGKLYELTAKARPTPGHHLLYHLREGGRLLRVYTQNIDGLEEAAGLTMHALDGGATKASSGGAAAAGEVVQLHGDLRFLRCSVCQAKTPLSPHKASYKRGEPVPCRDCRRTAEERERLGKRSLGEGLMRSAIVLYNEEHPHGMELAQLAASDMRKRPDCLLIMGTSLKVAGCKRLVRDMAKAVHSQPRGLVVFVNATEVSGSEWASVIDVHVRSGIDDAARVLETAMPKLAPRKPRTPSTVPAAGAAEGEADEWEDVPMSSQGSDDAPASQGSLPSQPSQPYRTDRVPTPLPLSSSQLSEEEPASQASVASSASGDLDAAADGAADRSPRKRSSSDVPGVATMALSPRRSPRRTAPPAAEPAEPLVLPPSLDVAVAAGTTAGAPSQPPQSPRRSPRKAAAAAATAGAAPVQSPSAADAGKRSRTVPAAATASSPVQRQLVFAAPATPVRPLTQMFVQRKANSPAATAGAKSPFAPFKPPSPGGAATASPASPESGGGPTAGSTPVRRTLGYTRRTMAKPT